MTNVIIKCLKLCYHKQNKAHMDYFYHLLMILTSKHRGVILELSYNALKGHFGIKLECTEGPFGHIYRAVWAEGPFGLDNISWSDVMFF